ncbi:MAG: HAD-IC family P-type ATPase, partial [Cyanobacteria bacterium]|nr:HAD-IC family P-type ATPase [Cyanobacteriota bacterium]
MGGALLLTGVILAIQFHRGVPVVDLIPYGLVLLIAAVPETLPSMATFILSLGLRKFSQQSILIKNLQTMESLGNISVICTDKTGTLTQNSLTLQQICIPELGNIPYDPQWKDGKNIPNPSIEAFLKISRLNNTTIMDGIRSAFIGDPIDIALYRSSSSLLEKGYHRLREIPFDSNTLKTATILKDPNGYCIAMIKGAPEAVINQCQAYLSPSDGEAYLLSPSHRNELLLANQDLAFEQGLRVIGFAQKYLNEPNEDPYTGATFIGWGCLVDPPKTGVLEAIQACEEIGLRIIMITGDQKATAAVTANQLGILKPDSAIWTRKDLDSGVDKLPQNVRVFARTKPEEKLAIVESLQKSGEVVAMIGDGVNDTPALQKSDIAIAMGLHGTDAAKESSDIILLNDRLDKILETILTSRALMVNIKLCAHYIISCSMGLLFFLVAAAFL